MKKILLIITGSVACYKAIEFIRLAQKDDFQIEVVMTKSAQKFITPLLVSAILGKDVHIDLFSKKSGGMDHIKLSRDHDLIIVAPASANFIAKVANGICDDLSSSILKANNGKKTIIVPAMNVEMWKDEKNKESIISLINQNYRILNPKKDILTCGEFGQGKMAEISSIMDEVQSFFTKKSLFAGKKIIITAGATFEKIDPVRFIGNFSSGKQGLEIAQKLHQYGADVVLIASNVKEEIQLPENKIIRVSNSQQILENIENNLNNCNIFISVAAVSDFIPKVAAEEKIKKEHNNTLQIVLEKNIDILQTISNHRKRPKIVVGFAAESENVAENAKKKLQKKGCDLIIANDIKNNKVFGSDQNKILIINKKLEVKEFEKMAKTQAAEEIIKCLQEIL
jgi:phosphopantothenoylcysteine decarboxylase/phosphopantothenate--cysteine ligase